MNLIKKLHISTSHPQTFLFVIAVFLLCLISVFLYCYATPYGIGLTNDSAAYLGGARSLLTGFGYARIGGDGLPRLITHFPPMYSLFIAAAAFLGKTDVFKSAWGINLFCYAANLVLFVLLLKQMTHHHLPALLAGICYLCCGPILQAHVYGLSEALFLAFFLSTLLFLLSDKKSEFRSAHWLFIGFWIGILTLIRYIGVATLLTALIVVICSIPAIKKKIWASISLLIGFFLPVSLWLIRNGIAGKNAVNRSFSWHWPAADKTEEGLRNLASFFLPEFGGIVEKFLPFWGIILSILLAGLLIWTFRSCIRILSAQKAAESAVLLSLQAVVYFFSVIFVVICIDGSTLFDNRIFLPFYVCFSTMVIDSASRLFTKKRSLKITGIIIILVFSALLIEDESDLWNTYHQDGQGFASQSWRESETRNGAIALPQTAELFSNRQTFLWLMNNQPTYILPPMFNAANQEERESFEAEKEWMREDILSHKAYAVIFNYQEMMNDPGDRAWLDLLLEDLPIYGEYSDGMIFGIR